MPKEKEFRVRMDGDALVWAEDADDARDQVRENFNLYHYAEETGLTKEESEQD